MTKKTTEINQQRSEKYRYLEKFSYGPKLIVLCSIAMIVSMLSLLMSFMALDDAKHARIQVEIELESMQKHIERLNDQYEITQIYLRDFQAQERVKKED